ncbi:MAG TPA: DUF2336 domain-containing protein [Caulobacteraceae bacterium]|nr:DUF2336 domain-containing protein [Caulobacteraceae bacterium]
MSETAAAAHDFLDEEAPPPPKIRSRPTLLKRLADVVSLPASRINAFERSVTADLLVELLSDASFEERARVARRLSGLGEIPHSLVRRILRDDIEIARALLEDSASLNDCDLLDCVRGATEAHRRLIASHRKVSEVVAEALVGGGEPNVIDVLLRNQDARLSHTAVEALVVMTRDQPRISPLLLKRPELRPSHAFVVFWWMEADARRTILQRFAISREILRDAASDVFALAAAEGWRDEVSRKALQFIERRQRNRAAIERSPFDSLEEAVLAADGGLTRGIASEIAYLAGLKPMTCAKILTDAGGEPLAILCKATGLPRSAIRNLWRGLRRPETTTAGEIAPSLQRVLDTFDMISVDSAQTVLRYWNWALTSAMTPALRQAIRAGVDAADEELSVPQRAAILALSAELGPAGDPAQGQSTPSEARPQANRRRADRRRNA